MVCDSLLDGQRDPALCPTAEDLRMELEGLLKAINIINRLTVEVDVMEALNSVRQVAVELLDCEVVTLFLVFESRKELRGQPHGDSNYIIRVRFGEGIAGRVAQSGELMNIPDTYAHPLFNSEVDRATGFRTRNMLCCAISDMTGRNVAVLQALNKRQGAQFTAADERTLRLFGTHLGNTLAKAKLHDKARREQERLSALYQCFRALTLADDLDHVLELVATALRGVLHAEHAFVFVADLPRNELVQLGTGLVGQAAAQRVVRILNREVLQDGSVAPSIAYSRSISLVHRQEDDSADTRQGPAAATRMRYSFFPDYRASRYEKRPSTCNFA
ncbi:phosphodiesterase [Haematococcus lacustris]|uniref:Phosphodiesterase n=1 Tax=Haematococcus lacustris TaxID=44745 RepID=A0A699Z6S6_HAELA|nr:phosphodiesterase [Haematococcus lacustris]